MTQATPASAVEAATLLLALAIQDSRQPVQDLGGALQRMSQGALAQDGLARELAVCIESLQFHDRLVQQLSFARDLLATSGLAALPASLSSRRGQGTCELF